MATASGKRGFVLPAVLVGIGAFLAVVAILLPTVLVPGQKVTPLALGEDNEGSRSVTVVDKESGKGIAVLLDSQAFADKKPTKNNADRPECKVEESPAPAEGEAPAEGSAPAEARELPMNCFMDNDIPLQAIRVVRAVEPSDADTVTFEASQRLIRADRGGEESEKAIVSATLDRVTYDRKTAMPVGESSTFELNTDRSTAPHTYARDGISYKFPFDTPKKTFQYYDLQALQSTDMEFEAETTDEPGLEGFRAYHFVQKITEPINLYEPTLAHLKADHANGKITGDDKLTLAGFKMEGPAYVWGLEGDEKVTMYRYYTNTREVWVDPTTGQIVKGREKIHMFFAKDDADAKEFVTSGAADRETENPTRTAVRFVGEWDADTIKNAREVSQKGIDKLELAGKKLPIGLGIAGLVLIVGGFVLGARRSGGSADAENVTYQ